MSLIAEAPARTHRAPEFSSPRGAQTVLPHIPVIRRGRAYESLDKIDVVNHRTGEKIAQVSTVNAGIIRKDLQRIAESRAALKKFSVAQLIEISSKAGELFLNGTLPLGDKGDTQSADDYVRTLSSTSGLPHVMVRRNMTKIHYALTHLKEILNGLSRGLDLSILDKGTGEQFGTKLSFFPTTQALGLVMPSNSPAVNSLWLPAIALKVPVVIKPGREEPWTPYRLIQAFIAAGCPAEAFGFYPTDHDGAGEILRTCGRALIFGDKNTMAQYANNPSIQLHGPGWSKILVGEDCIENWRDYIDVMAASISDNGGRSCINASAIVVPKHAAEIADALAQKLGPIAPTKPEDENAKLSGFANTKMADFIDAQIKEGLKTPGAVDVTARYRTPLADERSVPPHPNPLPNPLPRGEGAAHSSASTNGNAPISCAAGERFSLSPGVRGKEPSELSSASAQPQHTAAPRKVVFDGGVYMRPTIVLCDSFAHPLANKEFLFPYASVVQVPQSDMLKQIGPSLSVTAITKDEKFIEQLVEFPEIERLNIGPVSTMKISWDQPHEGNMFEFLYKRRSIERGW